MAAPSRKRSVEKEEELNLVPIMNLVTILIPFLLMSAQFVHLAVIDSSLPAIGAPQPVDPKDLPDKPPLTLTIAISESGFTVSGGQATLPPMEGANLGEEKDENKPTLSAMPAAEFEARCKGGDVDPFYMDMARCFKNDAGKCAVRATLTGGPECPDLGASVEYPWQELGELIRKIKDEYPDDENVILLPDPTTAYVDIVHTMDVTRERKVEDEDGKKVLEPWFPNVVLAGGMKG